MQLLLQYAATLRQAWAPSASASFSASYTTWPPDAAVGIDEGAEPGVVILAGNGGDARGHVGGASLRA